MPAPGTAASIMDSLTLSPLGSLDGEASLHTPYNQGSNTVIVRARNRSAELERNKYHEDRMSWMRGGEIYEEEVNKKAVKTGSPFNLERARRDAYALGNDPTPFRKGLFPTDLFLKFDNRHYKLPALGANGEIAPWMDVPEGLYDLYVGNYVRMNSTNPKIKGDELALVRLRRGNADRDLVIRPGVKNDWAFLEFDYKIIQPTAVVLDADSVYADNVMEI